MDTLVFVDKLDEVLVKRVLDGEATLAEFHDLKPLITDRMNYVVRKIVEIINLKLDWWDFDNLGEGNEDHGYFDPDRCIDSVRVVIECNGDSYKNTQFDMYNSRIPVEFLWIDFETIVTNQFEEFKAAIDSNESSVARKSMQDKENMQRIIASVKSKLTAEELSYIQFQEPKKSKKHRQ